MQLLFWRGSLTLGIVDEAVWDWQMCQSNCACVSVYVVARNCNHGNQAGLTELGAMPMEHSGLLSSPLNRPQGKAWCEFCLEQSSIK